MAEQYGSEEREKMESWDMWDTSGVFSIRACKMQKLRVLETDASQWTYSRIARSCISPHPELEFSDRPFSSTAIVKLGWMLGIIKPRYERNAATVAGMVFVAPVRSLPKGRRNVKIYKIK